MIAAAPGSFQSELGCPGDWQPDCLRSWLQDPDGDGVYTFTTRSIPPGNYEVKVAIDESWDENYGAGGVQNGPNIPFTVARAASRLSLRRGHARPDRARAAPPQPAPSDRRQPPVRARVPGRLAAGLRRHPPGLRRGDGVWQGTFNVPAGYWEYKAPINDTWDENYGANAQLNGPNIGLCSPRRPPSSSITITPRTGSPATATRSSRRRPAASRARWGARATGSRTACARGCRTRTATASTPSPPMRSRPATTRPRPRSTRAGT